MEIPILYEDQYCVVINKPAGLVVHADGRTTEPTLVDWILKKYPDMKEVGEPLRLRPAPYGTGLRSGQASEEIIYRPGIVHRLDRETSGVLLVAKTQKSFEHFKSAFQNRDTKKIYYAFVYGEMPVPPEASRGGKESWEIIDRPIARSRKDFRLWSAQRGARGEAREAVTAYKVELRAKGFSYVEVQPKTGRTHQIRVHFKAINYPIVCDTLYAPKREPALGFTRLALHARSLEFTTPDGQSIKAEAPFPEDFERAIAQLKTL